MGQLYTLYNIDYKLFRYRGLYLDNWIFESSHEDLVQLLRWKSPIVLPWRIDAYMQQGRQVVQHATLLKLPNELLEMIFDELIGDIGYVSLCVACKHLLTLAKHHLPKFYRWFQPEWAGCRLICLGEYTRTLDQLPERLLAPHERDKLRPEIENSHSVYWTLADIYHEPGSFQSYITTKWVKRIDEDHRNGVYGKSFPACYWGHQTDVMLFYTILSDKPYGYTPQPLPGGPEVLCNLQKREYVRKDGLSLPPCVTLAHALFVQTIWSPSEDLGIKCEDDDIRDRIKQGPWAGDSFCITTIETLPDIECVEEYSEGEEDEETDEEGVEDRDGGKEGGGEASGEGPPARREWTDVTAEVNAVLVYLFEQNKESLEDLVKRNGAPIPALLTDV
ncbi:hypothetical protein C8Q70DRAFT_179143 [Cubamyces menziesii]|nr:hypothetical protein C8Q70DRAFT_179143 [Cubamyces menziesii]